MLIKLEFTESVFFNNNHVTQQLLKKRQDADISLSLDDFGTGYSSLKYLTYILVDYLKLDKSIIDSYLTEEAEAEGKDRFIRDIISLAHDLGKKIVLEGVETAWQAKRLRYHSGILLLPPNITGRDSHIYRPYRGLNKKY